MYMQFFILSFHWKYTICYFGKHNKGDKSYKFMLQVANFHRQLIIMLRRMKISYRKLEVANFHG